jgi:signal transduction histidine kinase
MGGGNPIAIDVDPGRAATSENDSGRPRKARAGAADSEDLQSLLADALRRLAETTGSLRVCAWAWRPQGEPYVIAATYRDATTPRSPDREAVAALESLWTLDRPIDLGAGHADEKTASALSRLATRYDMSCAMPLVSAGNERIALLLLGGTADPPGRVRPRTLAALDAAVARLRTPAAAATALGRLTALDAKVCRLDRLAAMGSLLAEVAHEIRNPLVSVKTFLHLLPDHLEDPDFQGEFRSVVLDELQRMERLLDTLLEHARPAANRIPGEATHAASDLERVLGSLLSLLKQRAAERSVKLLAEIELSTDDIAMDEDSLRQVVLNLMLNALEAAPTASRVTLRARALGTRVEFSVEDEGEGVPEVLRNRLFEPFFSTHDDRAGGLGLAITKKLIEDAGGSIHIEDGSIRGARFCVSLPRITRPS